MVQRLIRALLFFLTLFALSLPFDLLPKLFPGNEALYTAIDRGDAGAITSLLEKGADPNSQSRGLQWLSFRMDGFSTSYANPPLIEAIMKRHVDIAVLLLDKGSDPNARDRWGHTALMDAAFSEQAPIVKLLLAKGADANAVSSYDGGTVLHNGKALYGKPRNLTPEIAELLRQAGAK